MSSNDSSITAKSCLTDNIATVLQESRRILVIDNPIFKINDSDSHQIVLLCILHFMVKSEYQYYDKIDSPVILEELIEELDDTTWIYDFCPRVKEFASVNIFGCYNNIKQIVYIKEWGNLLPYALETFEYTSGAFLNSKVSHGVHKIGDAKKGQGIYYTPEDVISYMVNKCLGDIDAFDGKPKSFLDCSCGTGIFLLSITDRLCKYYRNDFETFSRIIQNSIWGIDISEIAILNAKFLFIMYAYIKFKNQAIYPTKLFQILNNNFICADATKLDEVFNKNVSMPQRYDCIIGNPPYVAIGKDDNIFIHFVENMIFYSSDFSSSALILPLSICYSQGRDYINLRQKIKDDKNASWLFQNFDRSPDSLFGDHVKTRNTIVFRNTIDERKKISSTGLKRWSSKNRGSIFKCSESVDISSIFNTDYIPKLQNHLEVEAYSQLITGERPISSMFLKRSIKDSKYIILSGTAYNWICAYDHIPPSVDNLGKPYIPSSLTLYSLKNEEDVYFCIAALSNRITYWLWTVIGDGFHVNSNLYRNLYLGRETFSKDGYLRMVELGKEYCSKIISFPTYSFNAGKKIVNYDYKPAFSIIYDIEKEVIRAKNISSEFLTYIIKWYDNQVLCGRDYKNKI